MWRPLGKVTVPAAGTPVRATVNQPDPNLRFPCQSMLFQQVAGNTGKIYICSSVTANKTTLEGVLAVLAIPTTNVLPSASATVPSAPAALNAGDFYVDVDVNGEACLVSAIRA